MPALMMERGHVELGKAPIADVFSGTVTHDVVSMKNHNRFYAVLNWGVGATGTITITVLACDDVTPTTTSAIPFHYRVTVAGSAPGAITRATSSGFTSTAGSSQLIEVEVTAEDLAASGYGYVAVKTVEVVDSPILGGIVYFMCEPRFPSGSAPVTATT